MLVIVEEQEFSEGWVFFYDSRRHQLTGAFKDSLIGGGPLIVNRSTGELALTGSAHSIEHYLHQYVEPLRRVREGWPLGLDDRLRALLLLLRDGQGKRDARKLDLYLSLKRFPMSEHTVLEELVELEKRGLAVQLSHANGENTWTITDPGRTALND